MPNCLKNSFLSLFNPLGVFSKRHESIYRHRSLCCIFKSPRNNIFNLFNFFGSFFKLKYYCYTVFGSTISISSKRFKRTLHSILWLFLYKVIIRTFPVYCKLLPTFGLVQKKIFSFFSIFHFSSSINDFFFQLTRTVPSFIIIIAGIYKSKILSSFQGSVFLSPNPILNTFLLLGLVFRTIQCRKSTGTKIS